jgi:hypothetical protein
VQKAEPFKIRQELIQKRKRLISISRRLFCILTLPDSNQAMLFFHPKDALFSNRRFSAATALFPLDSGGISSSYLSTLLGVTQLPEHRFSDRDAESL